MIELQSMRDFQCESDFVLKRKHNGTMPPVYCYTIDGETRSKFFNGMQTDYIINAHGTLVWNGDEYEGEIT